MDQAWGVLTDIVIVITKMDLSRNLQINYTYRNYKKIKLAKTSINQKVLLIQNFINNNDIK